MDKSIVSKWSLEEDLSLNVLVWINLWLWTTTKYWPMLKKITAFLIKHLSRPGHKYLICIIKHQINHFETILWQGGEVGATKSCSFGLDQCLQYSDLLWHWRFGSDLLYQALWYWDHVVCLEYYAMWHQAHSWLRKLASFWHQYICDTPCISRSHLTSGRGFCKSLTDSCPDCCPWPLGILALLHLWSFLHLSSILGFDNSNKEKTPHTWPIPGNLSARLPLQPGKDRFRKHFLHK